MLTGSSTPVPSSVRTNPFAWPPESGADMWRERYGGQLTALERVGRGAMIVDRDARVLDLNACVTLGDGLRMSAGVLQAANSHDRSRLQQFLAGILSQRADSRPAAATLTLPRPSGLRPWLLDGIDCTDETRRPRSRAIALLLITDVEQPSRLSAQLLAQVFELTSTEARLAIELASGKALQEISARLGISEGHARQRLKAIFGKTGTSRQGELIALLAKFG